MKLFGFIAGAAVVVFLILGLEFPGDDAGYVQPRISSARLPEPEQRETVSAAETSAQALSETDTTQMTASAPESTTDKPESSEQYSVDKPVPNGDVAIKPDAVENAAEYSKQEPTELEQWRVFWGPFARERSARRFAGDIAELSGVDTQVIRRSPSSYVVAFAYRDPEDKEEKEYILEQAIGMELVEPYDD